MNGYSIEYDLCRYILSLLTTWACMARHLLSLFVGKMKRILLYRYDNNNENKILQCFGSKDVVKSDENIFMVSSFFRKTREFYWSDNNSFKFYVCGLHYVKCLPIREVVAIVYVHSPDLEFNFVVDSASLTSIFQNCQLSCYRKELLRRCNCVDTVLNTPEEPRCGLANATQGVKKKTRMINEFVDLWS